MREWANRVAGRLKLMSHKNYIGDIPEMVDKIFDPKFSPVTTPRGSKKEITKLLHCVRKRNPKWLVMIEPESPGLLFLLSRVSDKKCNIIIVSDREEDTLYEYARYSKQKLNWVPTMEGKESMEQVDKILDGNPIDVLYTSTGLSEKDFDYYTGVLTQDGLIVCDHIVTDMGSGQPKFWNKVKTLNLHAEIVEKDDTNSTGIGVIFCDKL